MDEDERLEQTAEELAAVYGPGSPADAATEFVFAVLEDRFAEAWRYMAPGYRLCRAQAWLWNNRLHPDFAGADLDAQAATLAEEHSPHRFWDEFAASEARGFADALADFLPRGYGAASRPRPLGPDLELVIYAPTDGAPFVRLDAPTLLEDPYLAVMLRTPEGWRLAQWGSDRLPLPGWPPDLYPQG